MNIDQLKYPIGRFTTPETISSPQLIAAIADIAALPEKLDTVIKLLGNDGLEKCYRPGGWTGRQVVHHLADSHMNALIRLKLALTEENPTIKPYMEDLWAGLADYDAPIENSVRLITSVHHKWQLVLTSLSEEQWKRTFYHPGNQERISLKQNVLTYQWHSNHHIAHLYLLIST